jgi:hypothetical protein
MDWVLHLDDDGQLAASMNSAEFFDVADKDKLKK